MRTRIHNSSGRLIFLSLFLSCLFLLPGSAHAFEAEYDVASPVVAGNFVDAKKRSLTQAFRLASQAVLSQLHNSQSLDSKLGNLRERINSSPREFVRRYQILKSDVVDGVLALRVRVIIDDIGLSTAIARALAADKSNAAASKGLRLQAPDGLALPMTKALEATGIRVLKQATASPGDESPVLQVSFVVDAKGDVAGTNDFAVSCRLGLRMAGTSIQIEDEDILERGYGNDHETAGEYCQKNAAMAAVSLVEIMLREVQAEADLKVKDAFKIHLVKEGPGPWKRILSLARLAAAAPIRIILVKGKTLTIAIETARNIEGFISQFSQDLSKIYVVDINGQSIVLRPLTNDPPNFEEVQN